MNTKKRLSEIFELMKKIETKGDSTVFMADCLRALVEVINTIPDEPAPEETAE